MLDQSNPRRGQPCNFRGWAPDDSSSWAAQTFTAGRSGTLTDVVLPLRGNTDQITVAITAVDASGAPIVGPLLASTTVAFTKPATYTPIGFSFQFPARVVAGTQYAIVLSSTTESVRTLVAWEGDIGSNYGDSSGARCADGAYSAGRAWTRGSDPLGPQADFFFETYVVPAPTPPPPPPPPPPKPKPAAPTIAAFSVDSHPAAPVAGASFRIVGHLVLSNGVSVGAASVTCGAKLGGARLPGSGRGGCTFRIPKTAVGKRLAVTVSATYRGKTKTRSVAYTVRRAPPPAKPKPKPPPPPPTGSQQITTPAGKLAVDGVLITDRFPPGCIPNTPICDTAVSGYEILVVWLKVVSGDPSAIIGALRNTNIAVVASDGSQTKAYSGGLLSGRLFVAFTPRNTSHGFKLIWPGNPPIPLGK